MPENQYLVVGDPGEARTLDPLIKSQLLYQLSYGVVDAFLISGAKLQRIFVVCKFSRIYFRPIRHNSLIARRTYLHSSKVGWGNFRGGGMFY